jgi:4-hydroxy-3-methylbut-2-enyl diphosphate reductase
MKILRAKILGFCMGVRRAVALAERELQSPDAGRKYFTLGPLIHNPQVLESLKRRGLEILDEKNLPPNLPAAVVIIRAHGVSPAAEQELAARGARLVDATCPKVKANQLRARALAASGRRVFLAGEADHGEIIGIRGYVLAAAAEQRPGRAPFCAVVGNAAEAAAAAEQLSLEEPGARTALIGQTTISPEEYRAVGEGIRRFFPDLEIADTICGATRDRQEALRELCGRAGAVIVAGGRESANTRRLLAIARSLGKPCVLAEGPEDIPAGLGACKTVGICAGASTPDEVIDLIERRLEEQAGTALLR